jgi:transposase
LKGLLESRPIYHHRDERVQADVFVAALALLLDRALEKQLRAAGSPLSSPFAWQALETIRCVELDLGLGSHRKLCVTRGNQNAQQVLRILGITQLDPPTPKKETRIAHVVTNL